MEENDFIVISNIYKKILNEGKIIYKNSNNTIEYAKN